MPFPIRRPPLHTPSLDPPPVQTILDIWEAQRLAATQHFRRPRTHLPPQAPVPAHILHRRTTLTTAVAHARHLTALNAAYAALRALDAWADAATEAHELAQNDHDHDHNHDTDTWYANHIASAIQTGLAAGRMWASGATVGGPNGHGGDEWVSAIATAAGRLGGSGIPLLALLEDARLAVREVRKTIGLVRNAVPVRRRAERSREARRALARVRMGRRYEEAPFDPAPELAAVPARVADAVEGLAGWVAGMERWFAAVVREERRVYAEIAERDDHDLARRIAEALGQPTVLVFEGLMRALRWTVGDLDRGVSVIAGPGVAGGSPGSPWHQLVVASIPHVGRLLRAVRTMAFKLAQAIDRHGVPRDAVRVLAALRCAFDKYETWTVANFDRIHPQLRARQAEMEADPIYRSDDLHGAVREAFEGLARVYDNARLRPFLPLGLARGYFARAISQLKEKWATLPDNLRADCHMMSAVLFLYDLSIDARKKRIQCDADLAPILDPQSLHTHRKRSVRTATGRWLAWDAKRAEAIDCAVESAEQLDAYSTAAVDVLAALRGGDLYLERATELARIGGLTGPEGSFVVEMLDCAVQWNEKTKSARAHVRRVVKFHALAELDFFVERLPKLSKAVYGSGAWKAHPWHLNMWAIADGTLKVLVEWSEKTDDEKVIDPHALMLLHYANLTETLLLLVQNEEDWDRRDEQLYGMVERWHQSHVSLIGRLGAFISKHHAAIVERASANAEDEVRAALSETYDSVHDALENLRYNGLISDDTLERLHHSFANNRSISVGDFLSRYRRRILRSAKAAKAEHTDAILPELQGQLDIQTLIEELSYRGLLPVDEVSSEFQEWLSIHSDRTELTRAENILIHFGESDGFGWEPMPVHVESAVQRAFDELCN